MFQMYQLMQTDQVPEAVYAKIQTKHNFENNFINGCPAKILICDCGKCDLKDTLYVNEEAIMSLHSNLTNIISYKRCNYLIQPDTGAVEFQSCMANCRQCVQGLLCQNWPICFFTTKFLQGLKRLDDTGTTCSLQLGNGNLEGIGIAVLQVYQGCGNPDVVGFLAIGEMSHSAKQ